MTIRRIQLTLEALGPLPISSKNPSAVLERSTYRSARPLVKSRSSLPTSELLYRSFPDIFRSWDPESISKLAQTNKRIVRQTLFLTSNYYHNLMLVHGSDSLDVPVNIRGTLEAAHDAITAFFVLYQLFETEARVWWVFNHRAFLKHSASVM